MPWFIDTNKLHPEICKRFVVIFSLALIVIINLGSVFYDASNQKRSTEEITLSQQDQILLKQVNANLQVVANTLQQHKNVSAHALANMTTQLTVIQNALTSLPTQDNFKQLETTILQLNKNSQAANQTANNEHSAHHKIRTKRENHHIYYQARTALPFMVNSIDIWNGQPCVTIAMHGSPDLMMADDTRAGWTLVNISFSRNQAVFANSHHQLIKVTL